MNPLMSASDIKVVVIGAADVGKTCLAMRFTERKFLTFTQNTIGASFLSREITVNDHVLRIQLWDTAGHERFRSMLPLYYRGAHAAVLVFDVTLPETFKQMQHWIDGK